MQAQALTIELDSPDDWPGFRAACRALLAHGADPALVRWRWPEARGAQQLGAGSDLFSSMPEHDLPASALAGLAVPGDARLALSDAQLSTLRHACMHRAAGRFELCHRWLARMQARPELRLDALDADWRAIEALARPVSREIHKMHAFVRFRTTQRPDLPDLHIAWFEPGHHIVRAATPFFRDRFANMHWAILTPDCCAHWDGSTLRFGAGARRSDAPPPDAGEALWLTYYASTFNPARLKEQAMLREMPRRYWHNLPETVLISTLVQQARARTGQMLEQ
jgi:DNA polymerase